MQCSILSPGPGPRQAMQAIQNISSEVWSLIQSMETNLHIGDADAIPSDSIRIMAHIGEAIATPLDPIRNATGHRFRKARAATSDSIRHHGSQQIGEARATPSGHSVMVTLEQI